MGDEMPREDGGAMKRLPHGALRALWGQAQFGRRCSEGGCRHRAGRAFGHDGYALLPLDEKLASCHIASVAVWQSELYPCQLALIWSLLASMSSPRSVDWHETRLTRRC